MRLRITLVSIGICALIIGLSGDLRKVRAQESQKNPAQVEWQTYELGKGTFSVLLPGKPTENVQSGEDEIYLYILAPEWGFLVMNYTLLNEEAEKWPEERSEPFYKGFWEGISGSLNERFKNSNNPTTVTLQDQRPITFAGQKGFEFTFTIHEQRGRLLITRIGRRTFSAMIIGTESALTQNQDTIFGSFKILPQTDRAKQQ